MDHEVGPWKMVFLNGPSSWSNFHVSTSLNISFQILGPHTRCKPNVDQEEWTCINRWMWWFVGHHAQKGQLRETFKFDRSSVFFGASLIFHFLLNVSKMWLANLLKTIFRETNERFHLNMFNVTYMWLVLWELAFEGLVFEVLVYFFFPQILTNTKLSHWIKMKILYLSIH